jgi:fructose-specific phosphotransferase system IIA component
MNVYALDKKSCLYEMCEMLEKQGIIDSIDVFYDAILEREKLMSTGIGKQIAIPHARVNTVQELKIAVYLLANDIDFAAVDDLPVKIIFMIAVPEQMKQEYVKALSAISNFYRREENQKRIQNCQSKEELCNILKEIENAF